MVPVKEGTYPTASRASSRRVSLQKVGWVAVATKKVDSGYEVWGIKPESNPAPSPAPPLGKASRASPAPSPPPTPPAVAPSRPGPLLARANGPKNQGVGIKGGGSSRKGIKLENPGPRGKPKGATTGLSVKDVWVKLFKENEELPDGKKLTDTQITAFLNREFVNRGSKVFSQVASVRAKYNRGGFSGGVKPTKPSICYGA